MIYTPPNPIPPGKVYLYITGGSSDPNPYSVVLTNNSTDKEYVWGWDLTQPIPIYLQQIVGNRFVNYLPGSYTLNIVNGDWANPTTIPFTITYYPFILDTSDMKLYYTGTGTPPLNTYIQLYPTASPNPYKVLWSCTYDEYSSAGTNLIHPSPLWYPVNWTYPVQIYLETPVTNSSPPPVSILGYLPATNYTLRITDFLQIFYETTFDVGNPSISVSTPSTSPSTTTLTVTSFPQVGYVSIHSAQTDVSILDWARKGATEPNDRVWAYPFKGAIDTLVLNLVKYSTNNDNPVPYTPGVLYYVRLTDYRSLTRWTTFTIPSVTKTITSNKSTYAFEDTITLTTQNITNGSAVTLYNTSDSSGYSAVLDTINNNQSVKLITNIQTLRPVNPMPLTVFTLYTSSRTFLATCDGASTSSFTIAAPSSAISQLPAIVGDTLDFTGFNAGQKYLVTENSDAVYYCNAGTSTFTLAYTTQFYSLYTNAVLLLSDLYGTFYIAGVNQVSTAFSITNGTQSNISLQWKQVFEDNLELTKAGLYNTSFTNPYFTSGGEIVDISGYGTSNNSPFIPNTSYPNDKSSTASPIELIKNGTILSYGSSTDNLGINNGTYYVSIPETSKFRIGSGYIQLNTTNKMDETLYETVNVVTDNGKFTLFNASSPFILTTNISEVRFGVNNTVEILLGPFTFAGSPTAGDISGPYPVPGSYTNPDGTVYTGGGQTDIKTMHNINPFNNNAIVSNSYYGTNPSRWIIEFQNNILPTSLPAVTVNLQVGCNGYTSFVDIPSKNSYYYGKGSIYVSIPPANATGFQSPIYGPGNVAFTNSFVVSSNAIFQPASFPPTLDVIEYTNLPGLSTMSNYHPTMIPGGDYRFTTTPVVNQPIQIIGDSTKMDSDQCRQPWRLSHYVRANSVNGSNTQDAVIKIGYNTAAALVYAASLDTVFPGRLGLGVNIWNFVADHGSYSGDMVPPLLALIDAFTLKGVSIDQDITAYSANIKALNPSNVLSVLVTRLNNANDKTVYPILSSSVDGAQQLGLGAVGFVCTTEFLCRPNFDVMLKYDHINQNGWGDCDAYTNPAQTTYTDEAFLNWITIYKMSAFRGIKFLLSADWPDITIRNDYGELINYGGEIQFNAYMTNIRIRDINVTIEDELSYGGNYQGTDGINTFYLYTNDTPDGKLPSYGTPGSGYVFTDFPMYSLPDRGWGSLTMEIISYMGIMFVGMNDYTNFCKWHRTVWHLMFIQNGGDMYGWNEADDSDKIIKQNGVLAPAAADHFWLPSYLCDSVDTTNWYLGKPYHTYDVYKFPPENYYSDVQGNPPLNRADHTTTIYWANNWSPYRGDETGQSRDRWSTPSYCLGYSPLWVIGGKTDTTGFEANETANIPNRPIAETLNPFYNNVSGLYTATDADENLLQAYILASLRWKSPPTLDTDVTKGLPTNFEQPQCPTTGSVPEGAIKYGYDCDVSDFWYSTDKKMYVPNTPTNGTNSGVSYASTNANLKAKRWNNNPIDNLPGQTGVSNSNVTDKIGYGITYKYNPDGTGQWSFPTKNGERCTTWEYIAKSIQRTLISRNGNGYAQNFGNFTSELPTPDGSRFLTLGHNTGSWTSYKLDYIDPRLMQVCETVTYDGTNA